MRRLLFLALLAIAFGCKKPEEATPPATAPNPSAVTAHQAPAGNGGGIAPIGSGAVGGITPVTGSESVEGAGMGGIGQAAKSQAMKAAASSSAPNLGQSSDGE